MRTFKTLNRRAGMTLIESTVAVTFLIGAGAMLLPSMGKTREDAKRVTCQSNLGQIGTAMLSYRAELGRYPVFATSDYSWCTWAYGGWSGTNREFWYGQFSAWNIQTNRRPLTVYMTAWEIPDQKDIFTPTQEAPLFKCPSDNISSQWQWGNTDQQFTFSAYNDVGTSYAINFNWWDQALEDANPSDPWDYVVSELGGLIFDKYAARQPSRFITLMEDPAAWGLGAGGLGQLGIQTEGYHGDFSTHMAAFADGHAEYLYMDTRHLHDSLPNPPGPRHGESAPYGDWTVCDENNDHPSGGRHQ